MFSGDGYPAQPADVPWPTEEWPIGELPAGFDSAYIDEFLTWAFDTAGGRELLHRRHRRGAGRRGDDRALHDGLGSRRAARVVVDGQVDHPGDARHPRRRRTARRVRPGRGAGVGRTETIPATPSPSTTMLHMRSGLEWVEEYEGTSDVIEMLFGEGSDDRAHFAAERAAAAAPGDGVELLDRHVDDPVADHRRPRRLLRRGHAVGAGRAVRPARDHVGGPRPRRHRRDERRVGDQHDGPRLRPLRTALPARRRVGRRRRSSPRRGSTTRACRSPMPRSTAPTGGSPARTDKRFPTSFAANGFNGQSIIVVPEPRPRRRRPRQRAGRSP